MFGNLFSRSEDRAPEAPSLMGLSTGRNFEIETLDFRMHMEQLTIASIDRSHIIEATGLVEQEGSHLLRFYTDTDGWLQVVCDGPVSESSVTDVTLFYFYDTLDVSDEASWERLLREKIGQPWYDLDGTRFHRVWESESDYHMPVLMAEKTWDSEGNISLTDQFVMLFEREVASDLSETLYVSAEERQDAEGGLSRCLVLSTGLPLGPAQLKVY